MHPSKHEAWPNIGYILSHRLRRRPNIKQHQHQTTLGQRLVFAGQALKFLEIQFLKIRFQSVSWRSEATKTVTPNHRGLSHNDPYVSYP